MYMSKQNFVTNNIIATKLQKIKPAIIIAGLRINFLNLVLASYFDVFYFLIPQKL